MRYKTIVLQMLFERTELCDHLRETKTFMPTLERFAEELRANHLIWMEALSGPTADSAPMEIERDALETAMLDLELCLSHALQTDEPELFSLERAINFIRSRSFH